MDRKISTTVTKVPRKWKVRASANAVAFAAVVGCLAFSGAPARADIITSLSGLAAADGTGGWLYTYTASLAGQQNAQPVAFGGTAGVGIAFGTVYDFGPLKSPITATGLLATNFTFSTSLTNTPAVGTLPVDNPNVLNIRFTDTAANIPANTFLGTFTANSASGPNTVLSYFDGQAAKDAPGTLEDDTLIGNIGRISVPAAAAVPEPLSLALLGMGLLGVALSGWRKGSRMMRAV
jgi:hypothetical protein